MQQETLRLTTKQSTFDYSRPKVNLQKQFPANTYLTTALITLLVDKKI